MILGPHPFWPCPPCPPLPTDSKLLPAARASALGLIFGSGGIHLKSTLRQPLLSLPLMYRCQSVPDPELEPWHTPTRPFQFKFWPRTSSFSLSDSRPSTHLRLYSPSIHPMTFFLCFPNIANSSLLLFIPASHRNLLRATSVSTPLQHPFLSRWHTFTRHDFKIASPHTHEYTYIYTQKKNVWATMMS